MVVATAKIRKAASKQHSPESLIVPVEHETDMSLTEWRADAYIVCRNDKGVRRYLRKSSIEDLLSQVDEGSYFRFKGLRTTQSLGQAEFLLAMSWMKVNNLVLKEGRQYMIPSVEAVKRQWNAIVNDEATL